MIHITASSDDNYVRHLGVVLQSLLANTSIPNKIQIHLIEDNVSDDNLNKLSQCVSKFGAHLNIISSDKSRYANLPTLRYGISAYQRISLGDYLPSSVNKVIYLDCDILVLDDIKNLWEMSLEKKPLGAIENLSPKACKSLGFSRQEYFNSGVLVADLQQWREDNLYDKAVDFIQQNASKLQFIDQCTLNYLFKNKWQKLPLIWNQQADIYGVLKKYNEGCGYQPSEIKYAINKPSLVHFIGKQKPWMLDCFHPFKKYYWYYLEKTPWKGSKFIDDSLMNRAINYLSFRKIIKQQRRISALRSQLEQI